jgi:hypothetical protein
MVKLPHYKNAWQIQEKNSWPPVNDVSVAVKIFYIKWKKEFGDQDKKVYRALNKLVIEWDNSNNRKILGYFVDGKIKRGIVKGIALSPSYIRIYKTDYEKIGSTSLIHELTHIALWNSGNILGDPDHEGLEYSGWTSKHTKMIKDLNRILANIDI